MLVRGSPGSHYWDYYPDNLSCSKVSATDFKIGYKQIPSTGALSSNELQWFDLKSGHQYGSPSNDHQGDMPYIDQQETSKGFPNYCWSLMTTGN